jgi:hypothetical protein
MILFSTVASEVSGDRSSLQRWCLGLGGMRGLGADAGRDGRALNRQLSRPMQRLARRGDPWLTPTELHLLRERVPNSVD